MVRCEVLICGAGISGLLLASELSKTCSVLVLERNPQALCSNKFWLTKRTASEANPELSACIDSEWNEMDFISNRRAVFTAKGRYVLWNTKKLEAFLLQRIRANGSEVRYEHRFYSYRYEQDEIVSQSNNTTIQSKLLVDCMGCSSPIVGSSGAIDILGYHHLYGRTMVLKKGINPVAVDNVLLSGSPTYLEVFPRSDGLANVVLISPAKRSESVKQLGRDFDFVVKSSHYSDYLEESSTVETLGGIVPIGKVKKTALDRIIFYGEAGQIHPAASCTCLNKLLHSYKDVAAKIALRLGDDQLGVNDLKRIVPRMNRFAQRFHQNLYKEMHSWTSDQGEAFVELLHCLDQKSLDDLVFGEIGPAHFAQIANLKRILEKGNTIWLKPLIRTAFSF